MNSIEPYYSLPANASVTADELWEILIQLPETDANTPFVAANIHLEMATECLTSKHAKSSHRMEAWELLHQVVQNKSRTNWQRRAQAETLLATFPAFLDSYPSPAKQKVARNLFSLIRHDTNLIGDSALAQDRLGRRAEILTMLLIGHTGLSGLIARPSYSRQETSWLSIDEKNHNWDVTVVSDGSTIPSGIYALQVKSGSRKKLKQYHPNIVRVSKIGLGLLSSSPQAITRLAAAAYTEPNSSSVKFSQEKLLENMQAVGPLPTLS